MELTQGTVDDPLAQIGQGDGYIYVSGDLDPQQPTDLPGARYGAPRALVLDSFTDPTVDESGGAALLAPFEDRAVMIAAWAYGNEWVGTGTVRDAEGVERPVLAVARRKVPDPLAVGPDEKNVDWIDRLIRITGRTLPAQRPHVDWAEVESRLGTPLPSD
ncbi:hypothetical protein OG596_35480 [Streptomyces sp. NBC_01102]|uniref:hypothetical protein n=1 Tax=Streptomyces sp. NBC_01102 TaxID=2903749 RepID=UPI0038632B21|nr:hypothetical protein OG596_35480 [Streptomyces sp. NBC_01102]